MIIVHSYTFLRMANKMLTQLLRKLMVILLLIGIGNLCKILQRMVSARSFNRMLSKLKYALDTFNHITTDRLCVGFPNFWYILLILSSFFFSLQILEYNVDFSTSKKDLFRRSFVSIISRARMDGRGPWQHRDEVAHTAEQYFSVQVDTVATKENRAECKKLARHGV